MPIMQTFILDNIILKKLILARGAGLQLKDVDKDTDTVFNGLKGRYPADADFQKAPCDRRIDHRPAQAAAARGSDHPQGDGSRGVPEFRSDRPGDQRFLPEEQEQLQHPREGAGQPRPDHGRRPDHPAEKAAKKKAIDKAHDRVVKGEDFSKVAQEVSDDKYSAPRGGDINFFQRGENEPGFDAVAFSTKVGVVSPVFETPMGYQFLKITDSQPGGEVSVADARAVITKYLTQQKQQQQEEAYAKKLLANSGVTYPLHACRDGRPSPAAPTPASAPAPDASAPAPAAK